MVSPSPFLDVRLNSRFIPLLPHVITMNMKTYRLLILIVLSLALIPLAGCSQNVPLTGTVVFSDDGTPLTSGAVIFTDGKNSSRGTINPDGSFEMGFIGMKDGIPPGTYKVYFFGVEAPADGQIETRMVTDHAGNTMEVAAMGRRAHLIDPKYYSPDTSELEAEVTGQTRVMNFTVDRYQPSVSR